VTSTPRPKGCASCQTHPRTKKRVLSHAHVPREMAYPPLPRGNPTRTKGRISCHTHTSGDDAAIDPKSPERTYYAPLKLHRPNPTNSFPKGGKGVFERIPIK